MTAGTVQRTVEPQSQAIAATRDRLGRGRAAGSQRYGVALCIVIYFVLSFLADPSVWIHGPTTHLYNSGNGDVDEAVWFLAQTPYALVHGINPFANNWLHFPTGVNLVDNTSMPLLGMIAAPVTMLAGPVLSYNLLTLCSFAASATAAMFAVRRWTRWLPAAFLGGLVYGFSPYMVAMGNGHLMTLITPIPPLVLLMMDRILVRHVGTPLRNGLILGALLAAEMFISAEVLSSMLVVLVIGVLLVLGSRVVVSRRARPHRSRNLGPGQGLGHRPTPPAVPWRYLVRTGLIACLVLGACVAYPAWVAFAGPEHIVGPAQTPVLLKGLSSDLLTPIVPTVNQRISVGLAWTGTRMVAEHGKVLFPDGSENGGYLGIPLVVLLVGGLVVLRRRPIVWFAAAMAAVAYVLSMGSELHVNGSFIGIPLPFAVLAHLPAFDSQVAARYTLYLWLFVALLVGLICDAAHERLGSRWRVGALASTGITAIALFPLLPAWPYAGGPIAVPAWFTSGDVVEAPVGSTLLTFPFPAVGDPAAMLWQAEAGMRFRMPGGYLITGGPKGRATFTPPLTSLSVPLLECGAGGAPASLTSAQREAVQQDFKTWKIDTVVVPRSQQGWQCAITFLSSVLGSPRNQHGSDVWTSLHTRAWMKAR